MKSCMLLKHKIGKKNGWAMIKIDFSKAYDILEWRFTLEVLLKFGFPLIFVDWIMLCFQVLVNGVPSAQFKPPRGPRQGD